MSSIAPQLKATIDRLMELDLPSEAEVQAEEERRESQAKRAAAVRALSADIGSEYRGCRISNYKIYDDDQRKLRDRAIEIGTSIVAYAQLGKSLFLYGSPGTGKDHIAIALLKHAVNNGLTARWTDCQILYQTIYDSPSQGIAWERSLYWPDIVCLSDPVLEGTTEPNKKCLFRIVNRRMLNGKGTWVTCNIPLGQDDKIRQRAEQLFGEQTLSRLLENADRFGCTWEDFRGRERL